MGKDKKKKAKAPHAADKQKAKKAKKAKSGVAPPNAPDAAGPDTVESAVRAAKDKIVEIATNPVVAEIVAATLVAAAAALRNPDKARQLASSAGDELGDVSKGAAGKGGAFWQLATDVARRTIAALDEESSVRSPSGSKGAGPGKG